MNHLTTASLVLDALGALLLVRVLAFGTAEGWVAATTAPFVGVAAEADVQRSEDAADAQVGAVLLVLGFAGQAVAASRAGWIDAFSAWWWFVLLALPIAAIVWFSRRKAELRSIIDARLFAEANQWPFVVDAYEFALGREEPVPRGALLARLFGAEQWAHLERRVAAYAEALEREGANPAPRRPAAWCRRVPAESAWLRGKPTSDSTASALQISGFPQS